MVARLLPWLPARSCVNTLGLVSRSALESIRGAFEVEARPGEDLRELLEGTRVPEFGTVRVPHAGVVLSEALRQPIRRNVRIAAMVRKQGGFLRRRPKAAHVEPQRAPVELPPGSLYGIVEFDSGLLCFDGLEFRPAVTSDASWIDDYAGEQGQRPPLRIRVEEAVFTCRNCAFEAELYVMPPRVDQLRRGEPASLIERCAWSGSHRQGLWLSGLRQSCGDPSEMPEGQCAHEAFEEAGLRALRKFAGDLDLSNAGPLVVPNGMRICLVRDCEAADIRHHALFIRGDVFALVEGCSMHGKVLIEQGAVVELRRNPHLAVCGGEPLDADFVGTLLHGQLTAHPQQPAPTRKASRRSRKNSGRPAGSGAAAASAVRRAGSLVGRGMAWRAG